MFVYCFVLFTNDAFHATLLRYNYIIVVGAEEEAAGTVNVRTRANERVGSMSIAEFRGLLKKETDEHK